MFDFLNSSSVQDAFPAGHHAIQIIRQWAAAALRSGTPASMEGLTPSQAQLVSRIVQEIEAHEGKPVAELSESKVNGYIYNLAGRLQELSRQQLRVDSNKGKQLLERLRSSGL